MTERNPSLYSEDCERIGTQFKADVTKFCEGLIQAAEEMEREQRTGDHEPEEKDYDWQSGYESFDDIETMFESLLQEVDESV